MFIMSNTQLIDKSLYNLYENLILILLIVEFAGYNVMFKLKPISISIYDSIDNSGSQNCRAFKSLPT